MPKTIKKTNRMKFDMEEKDIEEMVDIGMENVHQYVKPSSDEFAKYHAYVVSFILSLSHS